MPKRISLELLLKYNLIDKNNIPKSLQNKKIMASSIIINDIRFSVCTRCIEHHKHHILYGCPEEINKVIKENIENE